MAKNVAGSFAGYGRHTINDFLFELAIHPHTPAYVICQNDEVYEKFKNHLHDYMEAYWGPKFLKLSATVANHQNPFHFNARSNTNYTAGWVQVFRRTTTFVSKVLYNQYAEQGLLDTTHTIGSFCVLCSFQTTHPGKIGMPYNREEGRTPLSNTKTKKSIVYQDRRSKTYHIITAKVPDHWLAGDKVFIIYTYPILI